MATLPDNFAQVLESEPRTRLLQGVVLRQQLQRLAMKGLNATRAAQVVGCSKDTARAVYRDPEFRKEVIGRVDGAFADVDAAFIDQKRSLHQRLADKAEDAYEALCVMLDSQDTLPSLKAKIAMDFLDRNPETQAGHTVTKLGELVHPEQLAQAARIGREMDNKVIPMRRTG